ncbi:MAG TPA: outer membrane beta-barrel protein [Bacteroidales bacterium]|nr:outer membrane beta-barrel protein [Bacteroidales bacterium]
MKYLALFIILFSGSILSAQSFTIQGQLHDSLSQPLPFATVILLYPGDSTLVDFTTSNTEGNFSIRNVKPGNYLLRISFVGYRTYFKTIATTSPGNILDLGNIQLSAQNKSLGEVTVISERVPVVVKKDTIEFNASSFKTNPNANVEDLLKKMPGIQVKSDGKIMAQGQEVKKIEIEGKTFFGNDPTLATRNLPANAVEKVQVYDKKSEQATFTGIDDGEKQKTINLKLKADRKKALFGNVSAGAGTNDRFRGKFSVNRFNSGNQLSFLGMAGNFNEQGFSMEDYLNFSGAMQQMAGGIKFLVRLDENNNLNGVPLDIGNSKGIITNYAGGANINHDFGRKTNVNASYFANSINQDLQTKTERWNFLPGNEFNFDQDDIQFNENTNQRLNLTIDQKLDSFNSFKLLTAFNITATKLDETAVSANTAGDSPVNDSHRSLNSSGNEMRSNSEFLLRHKFRKQGRTFSIDLKADVVAQNMSGSLNAVNRFYGDTIQTIKQNQLNERTNNNTNCNGKITYTDRIGQGKYYEVSYGLAAENGDVNQEVFDLNKGIKQVDTALTNQFSSTYLYNTLGLSFRFVKKDYNFQLGGVLKQTDMSGIVESNDTRINKNYLNFLPVVGFKYDFTSTRHLEIEYSTQAEQPSLIQMQPVVDNSDPLNIFTGNPGLKPSYNHTLRTQYNFFSPSRFFSFFFLAQADYRMNAFSSSQTINENLVTVTTPVNVKYEKSGFTQVDVGFPLKLIRSRFNLRTGIRTNNGLTIINNTLIRVHSGSFEGNIQYNLNIDDNLNVNLKVEMDRQSSTFGVGIPEQQYMNRVYSADVSCRFLNRFLVNVKSDYLQFKNLTYDYRQEIPILNAYLSCFIFKSMRGEVRFSVSNILNRTIGVSQATSRNFIERSVTNSPHRYFMMSFTYDLNKTVNHKPGQGSFNGIGG